MPLPTDTDRDRLIIPALGPFYETIAQPLAFVALRVAVGLMLAVEGWPKITAPLAQVGFVEGIGFHPGWLWSPVLAGLQFFGGILIAVGLFTRAAALANGVMLAITWWFHVSHPYGEIFLTPAGVEALKAVGDLFTPTAVARLADGGKAFLETVQEKVELASLFWTGATFLFAAFGGGWLSVDRYLRKVF